METLLDILGNVGFDWRVALANLVNFILIFWLLKKLLFKPLTRTLEDRKARIDEGIENANRAEELLKSADREREEILKNARAESNEVLAAVREKEREIIEEAEKKAMKEADHIIAQGKSLLDKERTDMERALERQAVDVVIGGVEKVLREKIDRNAAEEMIKRAIA